MKSILVFGCFLVFGINNLLAQNSNVTAGGEAVGTGGTVSYSIGQVDYISESGIGGNINQGIQQPYQIFVLSGINNTEINLNASVYPNPTCEFLMLNIDNVGKQTHYQVLDLQGRLITDDLIKDNQTKISLTGFSNDTYFVKVFIDVHEIKVFKIIKTN